MADDEEARAGPQSLPTEELFVRLITENQRRLYAYVNALLPYRGDADDVIQETNVALWRKWGEFDRSRDFLRWACGIAYIEVLRHKKAYATRRVFYGDELMAEIAEEVLKRPEAIELRQAALVHCLSKLSQRDRSLIEYRYREGSTTLQTARDLGRPASTVYKAVARIRRALQGCIQRRLAEEAR